MGAKYDPELIAGNQIAKIMQRLPDDDARRRLSRWIFDRFGYGPTELGPKLEEPEPERPTAVDLTLPIPFEGVDYTSICPQHNVAGKCFACEAERTPGPKPKIEDEAHA